VHDGRMITAKQIKLARTKLGETQVKFAQRLGVDQSTVHRWETAGPPSTSYAQQFLTEKLAGMAYEFAARPRQAAE
jgi:DNA-binding transcriptional regulator YiaG